MTLLIELFASLGGKQKMKLVFGSYLFQNYEDAASICPVAGLKAVLSHSEVERRSLVDADSFAEGPNWGLALESEP